MSNHKNEEKSCALKNPAVAAVLDRLFSESDRSDARVAEIFGSMPPEERRRHMSDPNVDYRAFYGRAADLYLAVSRDTARLLYVLARATHARSIVEYGTSFGISTIHLAAGLRDNGGGTLVGSEMLASKVERARASLAEAGLADLVDVREGDALETLARDLPDSIDLVLLDGFKPLYSRVLDLLAARLRPGACIVADNADACPEYLARVRAKDGPFVSVPFGEDVELTTVL